MLSFICVLVYCFIVGLVSYVCFVFFFKQKTAYEMRISDWSSDVCSSDLDAVRLRDQLQLAGRDLGKLAGRTELDERHARTIEVEIVVGDDLLMAAEQLHVEPFRAKVELYVDDLVVRLEIARGSEARRGGDEWVQMCRTGWARDPKKKKK